MARIRALGWETEEYWNRRMTGYLDRELNPQDALPQRVIYVSVEGSAVVGMIAGHLTRRFGCDGELEWIDVAPDRRHTGTASELLRMLAGWFSRQKAIRICVDVDPANQIARRFYIKHGAGDLRPHWMVWKDISCVLAERRD